MNMIAQLKGIARSVKNSGKDKLFGIANEYQTKNGHVIAVGFTSCSAYVICLKDMDDIESESGYADLEIWEKAINLWIEKEKKLLDDILDYDSIVPIVEYDLETESFVVTDEAKELFDEETINAIVKKANTIYQIVSGEVEVDPTKLLK